MTILGNNNIKGEDKLDSCMISLDTISLVAEISDIGYCKHDVKNKSLFFDKKTSKRLGVDVGSFCSENLIKEVCGESLYSDYTKEIYSHLKDKEYKYISHYEYFGKAAKFSIKVIISLHISNNGDLSFVEVIFNNISNIVEAEKNFTYNNLEYRKILNNIQTLIFLVDESFDIVDFNYQGEKIFGEFAEKKNKNLYFNHFFDSKEHDVSIIFEKGELVFNCLCSLKSKIGEDRKYIFNVAKIDNLKGESFLVFSGLDTTEKFMMEGELEASELKFRSVFEQSVMGVNLYNKDAILIDTNDAALNILDFSKRENLIGFYLYDCLDLSLQEQKEIENGDVLSFSKFFDFNSLSQRFNFKTKYLGSKYISVTISKIKSSLDNSNLGYVELLEDRTKEYMANEELRHKTEQLQLATRIGNIGIYEINLIDNIYAANEQTFQMFEEKEIKTKENLDDYVSRFHVDDRKKLLNSFELIRSGKEKSLSLENRIKCQDGTYKWIKTESIVYDYKPAEEIINIIGVNIDINKEKRAEEKAVKRENQLRMVLSAGAIGLWSYDVSNRKIILGKDFSKTLGLSENLFKELELFIEDFFSIIFEEDRPLVKKAYRDILRGKLDRVTIEYRLNDVYSYAWVSMTAFVVEKDSNGKPLYLNGFILNIDEKTRIIKNLDKANYLLENSQKISKVGYYYYSDIKEAEVSEVCLDIFEISEEEILDIENSVKKKVHLEDKDKYIEFINKCNSDKEEILNKAEYRVVLEGKTKYILEYGIVRFDERGQKIGVLYVSQDVTNMNDKEQQLRVLLQNEKNLSEVYLLLMENVDSNIMIKKLLVSLENILSADDIIFFKLKDEYFNFEYCRSKETCCYETDRCRILKNDLLWFVNKFEYGIPILLRSPEEIPTGMEYLKELLFPGDLRALILPIFYKKEVYGFVLANIEIDASSMNIRNMSSVGALIHIINIAFEKRKNELDLLVAKEKAEESDKMKTAFLENMSHEIRTPLNSIVGFSSILADGDSSEEERVEFIRVIHKNTDQLLSIINDVIDFSEIESNSFSLSKSYVNVKDICLNVFDYFSERLSISVDFQLDIPKDDSLNIFTDGARLKQVLSNLVGNAIKYTEKGYVKFGYKIQSNGIIFFVEDTGVGIPDKLKKNLFNRFYQIDSMSTGTGLGLSIAKAIVEILNGKIWFESKENVGSTFYFTVQS